MDVHLYWIWWMSIKYEYDGCPSFENTMNVHHLWMRWMSIMYDVRTYWILDASHICVMNVHHIWCITVMYIHHICERPSWWNQWNLLVDGINWKDKANFETRIWNWLNRKWENVGNMEMIELKELLIGKKLI